MKINEIISDQIKKEIALVHYTDKGKERFIYDTENNKLFDTSINNGFLRIIDSEKHPKIDNTYIHNGKLVLFFQNECSDIIKNIAVNLDFNPRNSLFKEVKVNKIYWDSVENQRRELKSEKYLDYYIIVLDVRITEVFCKTNIC